MFGFLRFYLAWMVVVTHICTVLDYVGGFAVYSFFILSGYLMTFIMNENYGYNVIGIKGYVLNRFLRIFPPYWFVCILTIIGIVFIPAYFFEMHKSLRLPEDAYEIISNITIYGLFPGISEGAEMPMARFVPPAWALHIELCFYLLIGLFLGRYKMLVNIWLVASIMYHVLAFKYGWSRYSSVYSASLPFSLGAFLYHYRLEISSFIPNKNNLALASLIMFIIFTLTAGMIPATTSVYPFYLNIIFSTILIFQLSVIDRRGFPRLKKIDNFLGDLSYPIYLSHWLVATTVSIMFGIEKSNLLFMTLIPFLMIFSIIMKYVVDDPIERKRRFIAAAFHNAVN